MRRLLQAGRLYGLWLGCLALAAAAVVNLGIGFYDLIAGPKGAGDLRFRWIEQGYIGTGENPYDVFTIHIKKDLSNEHGELDRRSAIDPRVGMPGYQGYPPWSFFTAKLFVSTGTFQQARYFFALMNAIGLTVAAVWAFREGSPQGMLPGLVLMLGCLALFSNFITLRLGQYGILINAMLIGMYSLRQRSWQFPAGVLLGMAALKPQLSAPFGLVVLARRNWLAAGTSICYIIVASLIIGATVATNPIVMLKQLQASLKSEYWHSSQLGLLDPLAHLGVDRQVVTVLNLALGTLIGSLLVWRYRKHSDLTLMAICSVTAQLWSYHRRYDQTAMAFLLVALGKESFSERRAPVIAAFLVVGLSLWCPMRESDWQGAIPMCQYAAWMIGLAVLLRNSRSSDVREQRADVENGTKE